MSPLEETSVIETPYTVGFIRCSPKKAIADVQGVKNRKRDLVVGTSILRKLRKEYREIMSFYH
jgi:hypothetical protein